MQAFCKKSLSRVVFTYCCSERTQMDRPLNPAGTRNKGTSRSQCCPSLLPQDCTRGQRYLSLEAVVWLMGTINCMYWFVSKKLCGGGVGIRLNVILQFWLHLPRARLIGPRYAADLSRVKRNTPHLARSPGQKSWPDRYPVDFPELELGNSQPLPGGRQLWGVKFERYEAAMTLAIWRKVNSSCRKSKHQWILLVYTQNRKVHFIGLKYIKLNH